MQLRMLCGISILLSAPGTALPAPGCVDVALVLAIDASDSVDDAEYRFEKASIATALRDKAVLRAMEEAGTVAISAVFWGDGGSPPQELGWVIVNGGTGAELFAHQIEINQRAIRGNTDIGNGIWSALGLLSSPELCAGRAIVDISSDGWETLGRKREHVISLYEARLRAKEMDATINALVISDDEGDLATYYRRHVILGPDAFVMHINTYADYSAAIRKKLVMELSRGGRGNQDLGRPARTIDEVMLHRIVAAGR